MTSDGALPLLALGATALAFAFLLGAALLYHRIQRDRLLEQETRQRVYRAIQADPGIRVGTLAARLGLTHNAVKHHVARLEKNGFVRHHGDGQRHYFASGESLEGAKAASVLANPTTRAVYDLLTARGPQDQSSMGNALGLAPFAVSRAVARLCEGGLAVRRVEGRRSVVTVVEPQCPLGRGQLLEREEGSATL